MTETDSREFCNKLFCMQAEKELVYSSKHLPSNLVLRFLKSMTNVVLVSYKPGSYKTKLKYSYFCLFVLFVSLFYFDFNPSYIRIYTYIHIIKSKSKLLCNKLNEIGKEIHTKIH